MALKSFNVQGGLSVGNKEVFDANANLNLTTTSNVALGPVANVHITGGNANAGVLGTVSLNGSGNVTAIAITTVGDGYTIPPVITISGANTIPANATVSLHANGALNTITINNAGTGYSVGTVSAAVAAPSGRYLQTNGAGNLSWTEVAGAGGGGGGEPGGSNTYIQYNDNGSFQGTDGFTFDETSNAVTANGTITGTNFVGANLLNGNSEVAIAANGNITLTATSNATMTITDTGANITGTLDVTANANTGNLGTNTAIITTGNITTVNTGLVQNGNANVAITANGNITLTATSNATMTITDTGANITGTANVTNDVLAGGNVNVTANINGATFQNGNTSVKLAANANVTISSNGQANIVTVSSDATNGLVTVVGNLTANNFTTTGGSGNISGANVISANTFQTTANGAVVFVGNNGTTTQQVSIIASNNAGFTANYILTLPVDDGSASQFLQTDGSGILSWQTVGTSGIANGNSNVSIPVANGNVDVYSGGNLTAVFTATGANITGTANVTQDILAGGNVNVTSNINGSKFQNGNSNVGIAANGNITLTATSNATMVITDTGANVTGTLDVTANANVGNLGTATAIITTGNITTVNTGLVQNGNSNVTIAANGNIGIGSNGQANILFVTSNGTFAQSTFQNDVTITGNLTVSGNAIYANTEVLTIEDPIIELGTGANGAILTTNDGKDRGIVLHTYGNGAAYTTSGSTPSGNTTIVLASTTGIVAGQIVTIASNPNAIPVGTTVSTVNAGNIVVDTATTAIIADASTLQIGNDILRFMGWSNANGEFQFYSNATLSNEVVSGTLGNVNANLFKGTFSGNVTGNLVNGNSNVTVAANANVQIAANGNSIATFTSSGDGNLVTTGVNVAGYINSSANIIAANFVGVFANGNSNVNIPAANGNVNISAVGNANVLVVTGTGANITGTGNFSANLSGANLITAGSVFAPAIVQNASTYNTSVSLSSVTGLVQIAIDGNSTQFAPSGVITLGGASQIVGGTFGGSGITLGISQTDIFQNRSGNVTIQTGTGGTTANTWTFAQNGSLTVPGNINGSTFQNGNSNISIAANANVNISAVGNANVLVVTGTGANITGSLDVTANANTGNLGTNTAIITTGNITTVNTGLVQNGNSNIAITSNANVTITANSNAVVAITSSGDGNLQTTGANITGYLNATGNATASNLVVKANGSLTFTTGSSNVSSATLTTTTASANQALAVISAADGRAVEFIVKGIDSAGAKYTATTILALVGNAANADCDFTLFAQLNTGTSPGDLSVALTDSNANITLQVSPASTNSTVWTTQYRVI
jgi:hypothetical protein